MPHEPLPVQPLLGAGRLDHNLPGRNYKRHPSSQFSSVLPPYLNTPSDMQRIDSISADLAEMGDRLTKLDDRMIELANRFGMDFTTRVPDDNDHYDAADLVMLADLLAGPGLGSRSLRFLIRKTILPQTRVAKLVK